MSYMPGLQATTVAALPAASAALTGLSYIVTNALTPVALAAPTGGGAVVVRVTCIGAGGWIIG